jgi:hypothetical protein
MRNDKLSLQLYFMPPKMWDTIDQAKHERSRYYEQQRTNPHYLTPVTGGDYVFVRVEPGDKFASKLQRCATVTSVQDLLLEVENVLEYLKSHNGIVDEPINEDDQIVEDAMSIQIDGDANSTPAVRTAPDMRGGIPSANPIDTTTVAATPTPRLRMVQNLLTNDQASKRTHNTSVHTGHTVHPSKVQKMNPQANLNASSGVSPTQTKHIHWNVIAGRICPYGKFVCHGPSNGHVKSIRPINRAKHCEIQCHAR